MRAERIVKPSFCVIGKEGSTADGPGVVQRLWNEAESNFAQVRAFAVEKDGQPAACWGLMSDFSRQFLPWEEGYSKGLYLAGVECRAGAAAEGWTVWTAPGAEYVRIACENGYPFQEGLKYLRENGLPLAGAAYDHTDLLTGERYLYFPVKRL